MFLTKGLHPWAKRLVVGQDDQKVHYQCKEVPGKAGIFWVERMAADLLVGSSGVVVLCRFFGRSSVVSVLRA
jgi:hypothetical protein